MRFIYVLNPRNYRESLGPIKTGLFLIKSMG